MVTDYLKHLLPTKSISFSLTERERELLGVIDSKKADFDDSIILSRLRSLKQNTDVIDIADYGAGARLSKSNSRSVQFIAKHATIQPKFGQLYARIIDAFKLNVALELGTSLGIGTSYLAENTTRVITIEGCPETAKIAMATFKALNLSGIELRVGEFSSILPDLPNQLTEPAFVYIDGNHQEQPTLDYYAFFKTHLPAGSVVVFDDIYWSKGMKRAWQAIKNEPFFTVDLFKVGILLLEEPATPKTIRKRF